MTATTVSLSEDKHSQESERFLFDLNYREGESPIKVGALQKTKHQLRASSLAFSRPLRPFRKHKNFPPSVSGKMKFSVWHHHRR